MTHIVTRQYGRYGQDYLAEWDIIWGPVWTGSLKHARRFPTETLAQEAAGTAIECMKPVAWRVPDLGRSSVTVSPLTE